MAEILKPPIPSDPNSDEEAAKLEAQLAQQPIDASRVGHQLRDPNVITPEEAMRLASIGPMVKLMQQPNGEIEITMSTGIDPKEKERIMTKLQTDPQGLVAEFLQKARLIQPQALPSLNQETVIKIPAVTMAVPPKMEILPAENEEKMVDPGRMLGLAMVPGQQLFADGKLNMQMLAAAINSCLDCVHAVLLGKKLGSIDSIEQATNAYRVLHEYYKGILKYMDAVAKLDKQRDLLTK